MNFAIAGCGLVGRKRAAALGTHHLIACCDVDQARAHELARAHRDCLALPLADILAEKAVEAVIVCTPNDQLVALAVRAVEAGKHVLAEKPGARTAAELTLLAAAAARGGCRVKIGFNHRFHPALRKAHELFQAGAVGDLMHIRGRYGHGGRLGYEREWRASKEIAGGGELLDQGSHLIDLARWFAGDFADASGELCTSFWDMAVEDNAFIALRTAGGQQAWLHASWTEWKNLFSFEVFGRTGKLQIDGLGGSYGVERLTFYRMLPEMGPPETQVWEFPEADTSWQREIEHFVSAIEQGTALEGSIEDAAAVLAITDRLYGQAR